MAVTMKIAVLSNMMPCNLKYLSNPEERGSSYPIYFI
jgi:hypothetical protein